MKAFEQNRRLEQTYAEQVLGFLRRTLTLTAEGVTRLTKPEWVKLWARQMTERMVTHQAVANARSWREAARQGGRGSQIYAGIQQELRGRVGARYRELVESNAQYISSLPQSVAAAFVSASATTARAGTRAKVTSGEALLDRVSRSRAMLLARTETAKAQAALTRARAEDLGLDWYVWRTSEDSRVRLSHRKMQGVIFRYDNPPSPETLAGEKTVGHYNAGEVFNCRCYAEPLLRLNQVHWPHRVYMGGQIRYVTLNEFRRANHLAAAVA